MSLNPAWLNNFLSVFASAKAKEPGAPGGGAGIFSCFLTVEKAKSDSGTFDGADHTAAESLPFVISICLILTKVAGRFGKEHRTPSGKNCIKFFLMSLLLMMFQVDPISYHQFL